MLCDTLIQSFILIFQIYILSTFAVIMVWFPNSYSASGVSDAFKDMVIFRGRAVCSSGTGIICRDHLNIHSFIASSCVPTGFKVFYQSKEHCQFYSKLS